MESAATLPVEEEILQYNKALEGNATEHQWLGSHRHRRGAYLIAGVCFSSAEGLCNREVWVAADRDLATPGSHQWLKIRNRPVNPFRSFLCESGDQVSGRVV
jgi:hypothetical protein